MSDKTPYKVPVGYFQALEKSILNSTMLSRDNSVKLGELPIMEHILADDIDEELRLNIEPRLDISPERRSSWRSLGALAACFVAIIVLAKVGAYFVTDTALEKEALRAEQIEVEEVEMFDIDEMTLIDILSSDEHNDPLLAQVAMEYVDYYGGVTLDEEFIEEQ